MTPTRSSSSATTGHTSHGAAVPTIGTTATTATATATAADAVAAEAEANGHRDRRRRENVRVIAPAVDRTQIRTNNKATHQHHDECDGGGSGKVSDDAAAAAAAASAVTKDETTTTATTTATQEPAATARDGPNPTADGSNQQDGGEGRRRSAADGGAPYRRCGLVALSSLYTFFFVGSFFGWGPMQLLLEEDGAFHWKCTTSTTTTTDEVSYEEEGVCPAQTASLLNIQLVATLTQILSPFLGEFADRYGPAKLAACMSLCNWVGLALLVVSSTASPEDKSRYRLDRLLYLAFCMLAMSTWMGGLLTVQTGLYFRGHTKSRVIFLLNSLFDAGGLTYLILYYISKGLSVDLTGISSGYLVSSIVIYGAALYFWFTVTPEPPSSSSSSGLDDKKEEVDEEQDDESRIQNANQKNDLGRVRDATESVEPVNGDGTKTSILGGKTDENISDGVNVVGISDPVQGKVLEVVADDSSEQRQRRERSLSYRESVETATRYADYVVLKDRTVRRQLASPPFFLLCAFFGINVASNMWNMTSMRDFLGYLGDDELDNKYLQIFTLLTPVSLLGLPFVDAVILRFGFVGGLQSINVLSFVYCIIKITSTDLNVQIAGFVVFSFYRCFLFGITFSFIPTLLSETVVGKSTGILYAISAAVAFANIPLANLAVQKYDGNFFVSNLVVTCLVVPCVAAAYGLGRVVRLEHKIQQARHVVGQNNNDGQLGLRPSYGGVLVNNMWPHNQVDRGELEVEEVNM